MARRATVIREERNKGQRILVLDAGASLLNDRDPAKTTLGKSSIETMNLMGYDAMALGLLDISPLGLSELRQRMAEAKFPMLSANAYISGTTELVTKPYIVIEMEDHRVGILGLTEAGSTDEVMATDPIQAAREQIPELRRQADIIIVLSHAGPETDQQIADQVPGIAVIVSGRNQQVKEAVVCPRAPSCYTQTPPARAMRERTSGWRTFPSTRQGICSSRIGVEWSSMATGAMIHRSWNGCAIPLLPENPGVGHLGKPAPFF